jgi:preprotein translocase subunit YajC
MPILQAEQTGAQLVSMLVPFGLIILVFYFLIIRPQNKKQKETKAMLEAVKRGDRVVTIGGIRGDVHQVKEDAVILRVDDEVKIEFNKSAIASVLKPQAAKNEPKGESDSAEQSQPEEKKPKGAR